MTQLIVQGGGMSLPLVLDAPMGSLLIDTLRARAIEGGLPLYWRCGQGTCGACVVYLSQRGAKALPEVVMGGKERNVLARKGLLTETQRSAVSLPDTPALPRLACHVVLGENVLGVTW